MTSACLGESVSMTYLRASIKRSISNDDTERVKERMRKDISVFIHQLPTRTNR